ACWGISVPCCIGRRVIPAADPARSLHIAADASSARPPIRLLARFMEIGGDK
ncbi:hypothetical protein GGH92_009099, partial [Coemansia sp. RSA 2673]